uniref:histidine--tRNA ligase n=1 Tax=Arcella intermedia TaxID=1963864 RepID=A0A6B2L4E8_9EUKA
MRLRNWLFGHFREVARLFAFQEFDAPILESEELYKRKAGEEITAQMYNFRSKDGTDVTLRPEMTPTLARLILKAGKKMLLPIKWFSIPQCWRYETTTRGRMREHYQWNMDIVGVYAVTAEAELLAAIVESFKRMGLTAADVVIKINSRQVLQDVLSPLGIGPDKFAPVCVIVDKLDKLAPEEVEKQLTELGLDASVINTIQSTLSIKTLEGLNEIIPNSTVLQEFKTLWKIAKDYDFEDWLTFDASIVRGLAYYTGIVFECRDRAGQLRAIAGGGRYNRLLTTYGSKEEVPACGFGFGDCVIVELLKEKNLLPALEPEIDDLVIAFNEELRGPACQIANKLRAQKRRVDVQLIPNKKIAWAYNYADRVGASRAVFVAPDEWAKGLVRIKNLRATDTELKELNIPLADL